MEEIYVVAEDLLGNFILCGYEIDDKEFIWFVWIRNRYGVYFMESILQRGFVSAFRCCLLCSSLLFLLLFLIMFLGYTFHARFNDTIKTLIGRIGTVGEEPHPNVW
jgi:hypothetical protein